MSSVQTISTRTERIVNIFPEVMKKLFSGISVPCCDNLHHAQKKVLHIIGFQGELTMGELSTACGVEMSTVTSQIDALVELGLVERQRNEQDRRVVRVRLTKKGQEQFLKLKEEFTKVLYNLLSKLTENNQEHVAIAFEQLHKILAEVI